MTTIPPEVRTAVESGHLAHMVTINADGSPSVSIVWLGIGGDRFVTAHLASTQRKLANIKRDPRVVISLETGGRNEYGLDEYVVINGTAEITDGGAPELLQRLARVYLGPEVTFPPMPHPPPGHLVWTTPTWFGGVGPWVK